MINGFAYLDRFRSKEEIDALVKAAAEDKHGVYPPTHVVRKDGKTVGWFSINTPGMPFVLLWLSTKEITARESFSLVNSVESVLQLSGAYRMAIPVPKDSPFYPLMEKLGYRSAGEYEIFIKDL